MGILRSLNFKIQNTDDWLSAKMMHFQVSVLILGYEPCVMHAEIIATNEAELSEINIHCWRGFHFSLPLPSPWVIHLEKNLGSNVKFMCLGYVKTSSATQLQVLKLTKSLQVHALSCQSPSFQQSEFLYNRIIYYHFEG